MLKLNDVSLSFDKKQVISHLSYDFGDRGIYALMGPSGCGKTSLLRMICGLLAPTEGRIESDHKSISVSFQEPRLLPWLTAAENISLVLQKEKSDVSKNEKLFISDTNKTALQFLRLTELEGEKDKYPAELSGGMKNRVSLARALAHSGDLLLLDEPFSGLDKALSARMAALVRDSNRNGLTLVITHSTEEAELLGAKILKMEHPATTVLSEP